LRVRTIQDAAADCTTRIRQLVLVLGDPAYYRRFGFDSELASGFTSRYAGPHLMAFALTHPLPALTGQIDYAPAFAALGG